MNIKSNSNWLPVVICLGLGLGLGLSACGGSNSLSQHLQDEGQKQKKDMQEIKLYPIDEASQDHSFKVFRENLMEEVRQEDIKFILSILAPDILNSLGGDGGVEEFKKQWALDEKNTKLWSVLTVLLNMGGSFEMSQGKTRFCAPYVSSNWQTVIVQLPEKSDPLSYQAVIEHNVNVHLEPRASSPVITTLSYDVVKVENSASDEHASSSDDARWVRITTFTGQEGYISRVYVRGPSDYHACFEKVGEKWRMSMLAAGD